MWSLLTSSKIRSYRLVPADPTTTTTTTTHTQPPPLPPPPPQTTPFNHQPPQRYGLKEIKKDRWFLSTTDDLGGLCTDELLAIELVRRNPMQVYNACQDVEGKRFVAKASTFYPHAVGASFAALCDRKGDGWVFVVDRIIARCKPEEEGQDKDKRR